MITPDRLRQMAADKALPIGEAWNALEEAADTIEANKAKLREHRHMKSALRRMLCLRQTPGPCVAETNEVWYKLESHVKL